MAEKKKTSEASRAQGGSKAKQTRGENVVKNFGRAKPAREGILDWCSDFCAMDAQMAHQISKFFINQSGVDGKLKYWWCGTKQFPDYTNAMRWERKLGLDRWRGLNRSHVAAEGGPLKEPSGAADPYFKKDPLTADKWAMPFRVIEALPAAPKNSELCDAALSFIDQDDYLSSLFKWANSEEVPWPVSDSEWDGFRYFGFKSDPEKTLKKAKAKWFVPTNDAGEQYDPSQHGMMTILSESAVRTINWYLRKINYFKEFKVHRLEEIKEQFRGSGWVVKPSLKSYRLEWPTIRNLEESQSITGNSLTSLIEALVNKHLGREVAEHLCDQYDEAVKKNPEEDHEQHWEHTQRRYDSYVKAVKPLGNQVPKELGEKTPEELLEIANRRLALLRANNDEIAPLLEKVMEEVRKNAPDREEEGGNTIAKGFNEDASIIDVTRLYKETAEQTELFTKLGMVLAYPIPFTKAKPQVFTKVEGSYRQKGNSLAPESDLTSYSFVGYEQEVEDEKQTYKSLAEIASKIAMGYDQFRSPNGMGITPQQIMWASDVPPNTVTEDIIKKGTKIVCPDPRTLPAKLLQRLNPKKIAK